MPSTFHSLTVPSVHCARWWEWPCDCGTNWLCPLWPLSCAFRYIGSLLQHHANQVLQRAIWNLKGTLLVLAYWEVKEPPHLKKKPKHFYLVVCYALSFILVYIMYSMYLFFVSPVTLNHIPMSELPMFPFSFCFISVSLIKTNQPVLVESIWRRSVLPGSEW